MLGVLRGGEGVRAVEARPPPRPRHDRADVMACERATERNRVQVDRAIPALMRMRGGAVIGPGTLALCAMGVDARTVPGGDFGDRVCPVDVLLEGGVSLDGRRARFAFDHDEVARMCDDVLATRRQEQ